MRYSSWHKDSTRGGATTNNRRHLSTAQGSTKAEGLLAVGRSLQGWHKMQSSLCLPCRPAALGSSRSICCSQSTLVHARKSLRVRSGCRVSCKGDQEEPGKGNVDKAWSDFVSARERYTEPGPSGGSSSRPNASPRYSRNNPSGPGRDKVSKQETELLDFFSQESFFAVGGGVVVLLLVIFLVFS